jgi:hypothetical protein
MEKYLKVGSINSGDAVYFKFGDEVMIEKDHQYLVEPSPVEREEIYKLFIHLKLQESWETKHRHTMKEDKNDPILRLVQKDYKPRNDRVSPENKV